MELVGQTVPHGNTRVFGEGLDNLLAETAIFDSVIDLTQNMGGVRNGFLPAHLAAAGIQIGHAETQIHTGHLKRATGAGGSLFKKQDNVFSFQIAMGRAGALHILKVFGQIQQISDLCGSEIQKRQKIPSSDVDGHNDLLLF